MPNVGLAQVLVETRGGRSVVAQQLGKAPLQVHSPLYLDGANYPTVFLRTPSSGLLAGDEHHLTIRVTKNASLEIRTQASTLVYPGASLQRIEIELEDDASLIFNPHSLILARESSLRQTISVSLKASSNLHYSDHWSAGRVAMKNECWQFEQFINTVKINVEGTLIYRENWQLRPQQFDVRNPLIAGPYQHFRNTYLHGSFVTSVDARRQGDQERTWTLERQGLTIHRHASVKTIP